MTWFLGWLWWLVFPVRKALAVRNFQIAFPDENPAKLRRNVGVVVWSYFELLLRRRAKVEGVERLKGGTIALGGHASSWDITLLSLARHVPVTIFVKPPSNRLAAWVIGALRGQEDLELLPPTGSMSAAYDALERGRMVMFVQDQRYNHGIPVDFLGRPALTSAGFASMVWRTKAPVVGVWQYKEGGEHHVSVSSLAFEIPEERDVAIVALTEKSQRFYADQIKDNPSNWWWLHDRWRDGQTQEGQNRGENQEEASSG